MALHLDYFYGNEAEQYSFYRIPKALFTDSRYQKISVEAKVLYGLLLDRMSLSARNGWLDKDNKVYIFFTLEDVFSLLGWKKDKAIKLFKELDTVSGIGLIERIKRGQGRPSIIYVKNFFTPILAESESQTSEKPKSEILYDIKPFSTENAEFNGIDSAKPQADDSPYSEETGTFKVQTSEKPSSRLRKNRH